LTSRVISGGAVERAKVKKKPAAAKAKPKVVIKKKVVKKKPAAAKAKPKTVIKKKVVKKPVAAKAKPKVAGGGKTAKTTVQKNQTARSGARNKKR
jgi:hypothetical protein